MQYKNIFIALLCAVAASPLYAQHGATAKYDTIITYSGQVILRPARQVITANVSLAPAKSIFTPLKSQSSGTPKETGTTAVKVPATDKIEKNDRKEQNAKPVVAIVKPSAPDKPEKKEQSVKDIAATVKAPVPDKPEKKEQNVKDIAATAKAPAPDKPEKKTKTDKKGQSTKNLIADNKKNGYEHVPLAGEKAYFGEKNEYMNEFVRKYLELHNKTLGSVQNNSTTPFSVIDNVLEKKNLPKELKYLAVIESALNHNAVSKAGAVGPWQLMSSTARMMGLSVSHRHDDRTDLYKSTAAATKYLELLYSQLDDWLLVIAAYNSGPTPVQRAIERTGSHNFWDIKQYLPRETQGHVLAFIATASIFENFSKFISLGSIPVDFKFGTEEDAPPLKDLAGVPLPAVIAPAPTTTTPVVKKPLFTDEELKNMSIVRITQPLELELLAQEIGADKKLLARWNSDYEFFIYKTYPTPYYNLRLPKDKVDLFLQKKEALIKKSAAYYASIK